MLQEHIGRPEQSDASVMVNPEDANTAETDLLTGHRYSAVVAAEPVQSQAGSAFPVHHPFPFSTVANQSTFPQVPKVDQFPPATAAPENSASVLDGGGFNPSPFGHQFSGNVDRNILSDAGLYRTSVDSVQPSGTLFDSFSSLFRAMPSMPAGNTANYYTGGQPSSSFMPRADGPAFGSQLQSSAANTLSHRWPPPPPPDIHRPVFGQLPRFPLASHKSSVDDFATALLQSSAIGSDGGSPITDLLDRTNSPSRGIPGRAVTSPSPSMSDLADSIHHTVAVSPFCPSPVCSCRDLSRLEFASAGYVTLYSDYLYKHAWKMHEMQRQRLHTHACVC